MHRNKILTAALTLAAVAGASAGCSVPSNVNDQIYGPSAGAQAPTTAAKNTGVIKVSKEPGRKSVSTSDKDKSKTPKGEQTDKATQVHMQYWNNTNEVLNLVSAKRDGTPSSSAHWQNQAPTTLQPNDMGIASSYAAADASIKLVYQGADDGVLFTMYGETPLMTAPNQATGQASSNSYTVTAQAGTGDNPTDWFHMQPGGTFNYTGKAEQYVVPAGVTQLNVDVVAGSGGGNGKPGIVTYGSITNGAEIKGTLPVTPGETLTLGAGGRGVISGNYYGGWGLPVGNDSFAGGNGSPTSSASGGGASVILGPDSTPMVVAGGGGGVGYEPASEGPADDTEMGGNGGYNGSLTGQNGQGGAIGGLAGSQPTHQGQSVTAGSPTIGPGAGGGGYAGGGAGMVATDGGGGAGSSYGPTLTGMTVQTAPVVQNAAQDGMITLTPAN